MFFERGGRGKEREERDGEEVKWKIPLQASL